MFMPQNCTVSQFKVMTLAISNGFHGNYDCYAFITDYYQAHYEISFKRLAIMD